MAVVKEPTPWNDMVIEVRKPRHKLFDPAAEIVPLPASLGHGEIRPIDWARDLIKVGRSVRVE